MHVKFQGFPRCLRLLKPAEFQRIFRAADCKSVDNNLTLLACKNEVVHPRLGLAITKRVVRNAVDRNRIKRLVRESFRRHQADLGGLDIVVLSRDGAVKSSNEELLNSLDKHWQRLATRCANS